MKRRIFVTLFRKTRDPLEREFEKNHIEPMLDAWKTPFKRQVNFREIRGDLGFQIRLDYTLNTPDNKRPLTFIENKRRLVTKEEWIAAERQATIYARILKGTTKKTNCFVIAAPQGLGVYKYTNDRALLVERFERDAMLSRQMEIRDLLLQLRGWKEYRAIR